MIEQEKNGDVGNDAMQRLQATEHLFEVENFLPDLQNVVSQNISGGGAMLEVITTFRFVRFSETLFLAELGTRPVSDVGIIVFMIFHTQ